MSALIRVLQYLVRKVWYAWRRFSCEYAKRGSNVDDRFEKVDANLPVMDGDSVLHLLLMEGLVEDAVLSRTPDGLDREAGHAENRLWHTGHESLEPLDDVYPDGLLGIAEKGVRQFC